MFNRLASVAGGAKDEAADQLIGDMSLGLQIDGAGRLRRERRSISDDTEQSAGKEDDRSTRLGCRFEHQFVDIAPTPVFAGLQTCHDGVSRLMEVLSRMFAAITRQRARSVTGIFS